LDHIFLLGRISSPGYDEIYFGYIVAFPMSGLNARLSTNKSNNIIIIVVIIINEESPPLRMKSGGDDGSKGKN